MKGDALTGPFVVVGDIGSTFTKIGVIDPARAAFVTRTSMPTSHHDLGEALRDLLDTSVPRGAWIERTLLCSSAGGGLRVAVAGLAPHVTVEAGRRAAATAGARIVANVSGRLDQAALERLRRAQADVVLLVGGTDGGDSATICHNARALLHELGERWPLVVAGNADARDEIRRIVPEERVVRFVSNVLPNVGELRVDEAQRAIRELFVEHVIGRFTLPPELAAAVRMPTPSAVLAGTEVLAGLGRSDPRLARPVVVDVGGATTDVHSIAPVDSQGRLFARGVVPDQSATRTVEGDLGVRENSDALVSQLTSSGYDSPGEADELRAAADIRTRDRGFLPRSAAEAAVDRRLGTLAAALALERHAGELKVVLTEGGATLRRTGRDLREATCVMASGGVFEYASDGRAMLDDALRLAAERRALVPTAVTLLLDPRGTLAAAGLLAAERPQLAKALLANELQVEGAARVA
jgi:uncharacterized protein (TIGR01319 family)